VGYAIRVAHNRVLQLMPYVDLKTRFRAQAATQRGKSTSRGGSTIRKQEKTYVEAPPLPVDQKPDKPEKEGMQDFLDDLLG